MNECIVFVKLNTSETQVFLVTGANSWQQPEPRICDVGSTFCHGIHYKWRNKCPRMTY